MTSDQIVREVTVLKAIQAILEPLIADLAKTLSPNYILDVKYNSDRATVLCRIRLSGDYDTVSETQAYYNQCGLAVAGWSLDSEDDFYTASEPSKASAPEAALAMYDFMVSEVEKLTTAKP